MVDFLFFASNLLKLFDGGWFPLLIGGCDLHADDDLEGRPRASWARCSWPRPSTCASFLESVFVNPPARVDGTAVFLTAEPGMVPNALLHNLKHNKVMHEQNLFVTVRNHEVPWIPMDKRIEMEPLGHHCWQVIVHYGFKNDVDLPRALEHARLRGCQLEPMTTSYFLSRDVVDPHARQRHGAVAREAVRADAPQRERRRRTSWAAEQRGGGAGLEDRDLATPGHAARGRKPFAGKDIAPACKIKQDARAAAAADARPPFIERRKDILMHILFIADPLEQFKIYKDTTFSMMREAQRRGHTLSACVPQRPDLAARPPRHRAGARDHADRRSGPGSARKP